MSDYSQYLSASAFSGHRSYGAPSKPFDVSGGGGVVVESIGKNRFMVGLAQEDESKVVTAESLAPFGMTVTATLSGAPNAYTLDGYTVTVTISFENLIDARLGAYYNSALSVNDEQQFEYNRPIPSHDLLFNDDGQLSFSYPATSAWLSGDTIPARFRMDNRDLAISATSEASIAFPGWSGIWTDPATSNVYRVAGAYLSRETDPGPPPVYETFTWASEGIVGVVRDPDGTPIHGVLNFGDDGTPDRIDWDDASFWTKN